MNRIIQGLWVGAELSLMEQLSISSFLRHGHEYHLYVYDDVKNVPAGTVLKDAEEILPATRIFQYKHRPSYAGFSNFFRYKLLLEHGGWWADADTICLKAFDFPAPYVFSSERDHRGKEVVNIAIIKAPIGSSVMAYAWEVCQSKNPSRLVWGETGPKLMAKAVKKFALAEFTQATEVFCPVNYLEWRKVLSADAQFVIDDRTFGIHLWNEMWRLAGQDKNARYDPGCLYEKLKTTYLRPVAPPINQLVKAPAII